MNLFKKWQDREISGRQQALIFLLGALLFPTLIPLTLILVLPRLDARFGIAPLQVGQLNGWVGVIAIVVGGIVALWTIILQVVLASGSPFPMLPTQKLLVVGPFRFCRNPMTLGTVLAYAGIAILVGSFTAMLAVVLFALLLVAYLKLIEEKELELRFGDEYLEYKKKTPFIIPIKFRRTGSNG